DGRLLFPVALGRSSNKEAQQCIHKILRRVTDVRSPDGRFALFVGEGCISPSRPVQPILEGNHAPNLESSNLNLRAVTELSQDSANNTPRIRHDCSLEWFCSAGNILLDRGADSTLAGFSTPQGTATMLCGVSLVGCEACET